MNLQNILNIFKKKKNIDLNEINNSNYEEKCVIYPEEPRELEDYSIIIVKNVFEERKILEDVEKISSRYHKLEEEIHDEYSQKFEEVFGLMDLSFEYIPLYQINNEEDENSLKIFNENEEALGFYSLKDEIGVLRKNVDEKLEKMVAVHETVHHNLKLLCIDKRIERKSRFIEEGFTEFLTGFITEEKYIREDESKNLDSIFPYVVGSHIFKQIYDLVGLKNTFNFYEYSRTCEDLFLISYKNGIFDIPTSDKK